MKKDKNPKALRESSILRDKKGITLIALVITIIVILILAGVTIQTLTGDNGLLQKAQTAKQENEEAKELELIKLAVSAAQVAGGTITTNNLNNELNANFKDSKEVKEIQDDWNYKGYKINKDGKVEKRLPEEYQEVEYIESTGMQYINTNLYPNNTMIVEVDTISKSEYSIFGGNGFGSYNNKFNLTGNTTRSFRYGSTIWNNSGFSYKERACITFGQKLYLNGNLIYTFPESNFTSNYNLILFGRFNNSNRLDDAGDTTIYYCKIWDNGESVRNYIPCYSSTTVIDVNGKQCPSGTIGLYDTVEGKFYTNQGEGEFIAGPDV